MSTLIGIDLGVRKLALAVFYEDVLAGAAEYTSPADLPRDVQLSELGHFALGQAHLHDADSVWIEDVLLGNNAGYSLALAETKGAVMGSLSHLRPGCDIRAVNNKTWKKEILSNGNAGKDTVRNYIHASHPAYAPLCDGDQDRYDAACVGLYGLRILARAGDLHLTSE